MARCPAHRLDSQAGHHDAVVKGGIIAGPGKATTGKRERERIRLQKQGEKEARRVQRQANKRIPRQKFDAEDPDLVGLRWGPQPPPY